MLIYKYNDDNRTCSICMRPIQSDEFKMTVELNNTEQLRMHVECASKMKEDLWDFVSKVRHQKHAVNEN